MLRNYQNAFITGNMRFNEKEVAAISASESSDKEGRLHYKCPGFREVYKERWFKLKGNLFFYFRLNEYKAVYQTEPVGVLVLEQCRIQQEAYAEMPFTFSITFANDLDRRHYFGCINLKHCEEWINSLRECSYEFQRAKLLSLQEKIMEKTGKDPLSAFSTKKNGPKVEVTDSDIYFNRVHPISRNTVPQDLISF